MIFFMGIEILIPSFSAQLTIHSTMMSFYLKSSMHIEKQRRIGSKLWQRNLRLNGE